MQNQEILARFAVDPTEIIYAVTLATVLSAIVNRLGEEALTLTPDDLCLAKKEVVAALDHNLDIREFINEGLDAWEITRTL